MFVTWLQSYKITTKGHLLQFRLGTLHLEKGARHPQENFSWSLV